METLLAQLVLARSIMALLVAADVLEVNCYGCLQDAPNHAEDCPVAASLAFLGVEASS